MASPIYLFCVKLQPKFAWGYTICSHSMEIGICTDFVAFRGTPKGCWFEHKKILTGTRNSFSNLSTAWKNKMRLFFMSIYLCIELIALVPLHALYYSREQQNAFGLAALCYSANHMQRSSTEAVLRTHSNLLSWIIIALLLQAFELEMKSRL